MRIGYYTIRLKLLILLMISIGCKSNKKELVPAYVLELTGTYRSQSHYEFIGGTSQTETTQIDITKSDQGANSVNVIYIQVIKRYKGTIETPNLDQTWGPWTFKNVIVSDSGTMNHKETQTTNFGGRPGDPVETLLSIKGGVVGKTLTVTYGTGYPCKNLFNNTLLWLDKVN